MHSWFEGAQIFESVSKLLDVGRLPGGDDLGRAGLPPASIVLPAGGR